MVEYPGGYSVAGASVAEYPGGYSVAGASEAEYPGGYSIAGASVVEYPGGYSIAEASAVPRPRARERRAASVRRGFRCRPPWFVTGLTKCQTPCELIVSLIPYGAG